MQDKSIPTVPYDKHLGNVFGPNVLKIAIEEKVHELYNNTNNLMALFSKTSSDVKYNLFKSYCMSAYGSVLWDFSSTYCQLFYTAWRKCIRRITGIPYNTHCHLLHLICGDYPVDLQLHLRFIKFFMSSRSSKSENIRIYARLAYEGSRSNVSKSWAHMCKTWNIRRSANRVDLDRIRDLYWKMEKPHNIRTATTIYDLLQIYDQDDDPQLRDLINELCTM